MRKPTRIEDIRGDSSRGGIVLAGVMAVVMVVVLLLWMRDRDARDTDVELGAEVPTLSEAGGRSL